MPQLDITIFFNQLFWFFFGFFFIYLFISYWIVPKVNFYYLIKWNIWLSTNRLDNQFNAACIEELVSNESNYVFKLFRNYVLLDLYLGFRLDEDLFLYSGGFSLDDEFANIVKDITRINLLVLVKQGNIIN